MEPSLQADHIIPHRDIAANISKLFTSVANLNRHTEPPVANLMDNGRLCSLLLAQHFCQSSAVLT